MKIAMACDHRGVKVIQTLTDALRGEGHEVVVPVEIDGSRSCDYPDIAYPVAHKVASGTAEVGVLICGTGIGMSIAANKVRGVRAALVHDEVGAEISKRYNNANVLCIGADMLGNREIIGIVRKYLVSEFDGGRHTRRVAKLDAIESGSDPRETVVDGTEPDISSPDGPSSDSPSSASRSSATRS